MYISIVLANNVQTYRREWIMAKKEAAPKKAAPKKGAPKKVAPKKEAPKP